MQPLQLDKKLFVKQDAHVEIDPFGTSEVIFLIQLCLQMVQTFFAPTKIYILGFLVWARNWLIAMNGLFIANFSWTSKKQSTSFFINLVRKTIFLFDYQI